MLNLVKEAADSGSLICDDKSAIELLLPGMDGFDSYFKNVKLDGAGLKPNVIAIIDDKTKKDYDFLLTYGGFVIVDKNKIQSTRDYNRVHFVKQGSKDELDIGWPDKYANKNVNIANLYNLIQKLADISAFF